MNIAFGSLKYLFHPIHAPFLVAALAGNDLPVRISEFHKMVIENLAVIRTFSHLAAPHSLGRGWHRTDKPIGHIDVVDMLFYNMVTADPVEVVPVPHLIFQFGLLRFSGPHPHSAAVPIDLARNNFSNPVSV